MGAAWARHAMCESTLKGSLGGSSSLLCPLQLAALPTPAFSPQNRISWYLTSFYTSHASQSYMTLVTLLGTFTKLRQTGCKLRHVCLSVCLSACPTEANRLLLDGFLCNFIFERFSKPCRENSELK